MGRQQTTKKVKYIGTQEYINTTTGEVESFQVTSVEERDFNFTKIWMKSFLATLDLVGNAKTRVAYWLIDNITKENMLPYTYRQIATATGYSLDTVTKTMSVLLEADFLKKLNQGCYIINPDIMFKGTRPARLNALTQYHTAESRQELSLEEQLRNVLQTIERLTARANSLSAKIQEAQAAQNAPEAAQEPQEAMSA